MPSWAGRVSRLIPRARVGKVLRDDLCVRLRQWGRGPLPGDYPVTRVREGGHRNLPACLP